MSASAESLAVGWIRRVGGMSLFFLQVCARIVPAFSRPALIVRQIYNAGARSLVIVMLSGLFVGMVLGLLGFDTLQRFGSEDSLGVLAALGMLKVLAGSHRAVVCRPRGNFAHVGDRPHEEHR